MDEVSSFIESQLNNATRPGISANIVYKNKIIWEGNFGQTSKSNGTKPTGNTIYRYRLTILKPSRKHPAKELNDTSITVNFGLRQAVVKF